MAERSFGEYFANIKNSVQSIWHGMSVTLSYMGRRPTTIQYPDRTEVPVRDALPDRYRGFLEVDMDICTACKACERDCPIECIRIEIEGKGKERVMSQFDIDIAKCMFCGLCTENCPTGAIQHTPEFEAAAISMDNLTFRFVPDPVAGVAPYKPEKGVDSYPRKPLGAITRALIKPWDAPRPPFPVETEVVEAEPEELGVSELAGKVIGVDSGGYAKILEEAMAGTDCYACGYPTCQEYSEAIAGGQEKNLSLCEPGGAASENDVKQIVASYHTGLQPIGPLESPPTVQDVIAALKSASGGGGEAASPASEPPPAAEAADPAPEEAPADASAGEPKTVGYADFVEMLEEAMAGTDCEACDYPTCKEYAEALASGAIEKTDTERCEPGGDESAEDLKRLMMQHVVDPSTLPDEDES